MSSYLESFRRAMAEAKQMSTQSTYQRLNQNMDRGMCTPSTTASQLTEVPSASGNYAKFLSS